MIFRRIDNIFRNKIQVHVHLLDFIVNCVFFFYFSEALQGISNWPISFGSRIRHQALAEVRLVSDMATRGCFKYLMGLTIYYLFLRTDKNSAQTDEEKQRERQRNEREQKNAEIEAHNFKVTTAFFCVVLFCICCLKKESCILDKKKYKRTQTKTKNYYLHIYILYKYICLCLSPISHTLYLFPSTISMYLSNSLLSV